MWLLLVLAFFNGAWAFPPGSNRIVGGSPAPIEYYPFIASIEFLDTQTSSWIPGEFHHFCGGALITRTSVVTAAHCLYFAIISNTTERVHVRLGTPYTTVGGEVHGNSRLIMHEDFVFPVYNDVGIIRLATPATLSDKIKLARIAGPNYFLPDNLRVYTAGWGEVKFNGPMSDVLLHTYVHLINHDLCIARYGELRNEVVDEPVPDVSPGMLCTGLLDVGGQDACTGDSGGPVVHHGDVLVGIVSWGYQCAHPRFPGVNVRVPYYAHWIAKNAVA